jgi:hypothetical protein
MGEFQLIAEQIMNYETLADNHSAECRWAECRGTCISPMLSGILRRKREESSKTKTKNKMKIGNKTFD